MSRKTARGAALLAIVLLLGAVGSPAAAGEGPKLESGWWTAVAGWVDQALVAVGLQPVFEESNCGFDPNGRPLPCAGSEVDSRCAIDPDGQPVCTSL
jgi:NADPH-dependent 2,4-dienoyl-CoA reductase/sulfur reductase-like enzyme